MLPKGSHYFLPTSFDDLTQDDVDLMMSHINSYVRESANDVVLKPSLLGIEQKVRPEILKATDPKDNTK